MKTDLTYLKQMSGGSEEIIGEMIGLFIEQVQEISNEMLAALNNKEWNVLSKLAHKAKSSVSIMGMSELAEELKKLELNANGGKNIESYRTTVEKFVNDCKIAEKELTEYSLAKK
jgi:HPt (histidine-containing phosphotransfer) domain-containing protein